MATYSKCCAKSHLPALTHEAWGDVAPRLTHVVVLTPDGSRRVGQYDGYGMDLENFHAAKLVLHAFYEGETFDQLAKSGDEPGQGFFHDIEFVTALETLTGFTSHEEYLNTVREYGRLGDERRKAGFAAISLQLPREHWYGAHEILEMAARTFPPSMSSMREEYPDAATYLPRTFDALRAAALKFDEAFRALATTQARDIIGRYGQKQ